MEVVKSDLQCLFSTTQLPHTVNWMEHVCGNSWGTPRISFASNHLIFYQMTRHKTICVCLIEPQKTLKQILFLQIVKNVADIVLAPTQFVVYVTCKVILYYT